MGISALKLYFVKDILMNEFRELIISKKFTYIAFYSQKYKFLVIFWK